MHNKQDLYQQFEQLHPIAPSAEWSSQLHHKWQQTRLQHPSKGISKVLVLGVALLIGLNVFALSSSLINRSKQAKLSRSKTVAGQLLISTSSSKF